MPENTREVHLVDPCALGDTEKHLCDYTYSDVDMIQSTAMALPPARRLDLFEFEGIGLEWGCRLLPRSIVASFLRYWSMMWKARLG